jgi:hypothetical protein
MTNDLLIPGFIERMAGDRGDAIRPADAFEVDLVAVADQQ